MKCEDTTLKILALALALGPAAREACAQFLYYNSDTGRVEFTATTSAAGSVTTAGSLYINSLRFQSNSNVYLRSYSTNNSYGAYRLYRNDGNLWGYFYGDDSGIGVLNGTGNWAILSLGAVNATNVELRFYTDNLRRAYFNSTGLHFDPANPAINASSYFVAPGGAYFNSNTVYTEAAIQARGGVHNDTAGYLTISGGTSNNTYLYDRLGIGVTNPASALDVRNGNIRLSTTSGSYGLIYQDGTTQLIADGSPTVNFNSFTVTPDGKVGVGMTTPTEKLEVNGHIRGRGAAARFNPTGSTTSPGTEYLGWSLATSTNTSAYFTPQTDGVRIDVKGYYWIGLSFMMYDVTANEQVYASVYRTDAGGTNLEALCVPYGDAFYTFGLGVGYARLQCVVASYFNATDRVRVKDEVTGAYIYGSAPYTTMTIIRMN